MHNDRLVDALHAQAFSAINGSPGARAYYDKQRARDVDHGRALRHVANRLVGILHGCRKTGTAFFPQPPDHDQENSTKAEGVQKANASPG